MDAVAVNRDLAHRALGEAAGAAADARPGVVLYDALPSLLPEDWYFSACCHAVLAELAGQAGSDVSAGERQSEAARAMALLQRAVAMGYANEQEYRTDEALNPLRARDDFQQLLLDMAMPAQPFAPGR